jgi:hypothetical protein
MMARLVIHGRLRHGACSASPRRPRHRHVPALRPYVLAPEDEPNFQAHIACAERDITLSSASRISTSSSAAAAAAFASLASRNHSRRHCEPDPHGGHVRVTGPRCSHVLPRRWLGRPNLEPALAKHTSDPLLDHQKLHRARGKHLADGVLEPSRVPDGHQDRRHAAHPSETGGP